MEYYSFHHQLGKFFETYYVSRFIGSRAQCASQSSDWGTLSLLFWKPNELINWPIALNIRELSFFGRKQELSQLEEYLSLVETGEAVGPFLVMGQSGTGKKRLLRQLVLMSNRSFNFIKVEGKATSQRMKEELEWSQTSARETGDEMGISFWKREDDLISYGISFRP